MSKRFSFHLTSLEGLWVAERKAIQDQRGSFSRMFCADDFSDIGWNESIIQINQSTNRVKGTVRGLHYQHPPHTEMRIVYCMRGEVFDVAVDLRHNSDTFLCWHGEIISATNKRCMVIPAGYAHGFQTLDNECELIYLHTGRYNPETETGINILDPTIHIKWPLPVCCLSERDKKNPYIDDEYQGVLL